MQCSYAMNRYAQHLVQKIKALGENLKQAFAFNLRNLSKSKNRNRGCDGSDADIVPLHLSFSKEGRAFT